MIVITLQQFFVLLWIFCITKVILHGFRINIIGISINRYFYEYNLDDKNVIKEYHRGRAVRSIIILIIMMNRKKLNNSKMIDYRIDSWYNIMNVKICASKEISYR